MMVPAAFDQENVLLGPPEGISVDECETISVWMGDTDEGVPLVISCWKLTAEDLENITRTGRVWLTVLGHAMPPVILSGATPFEEDT